MITLFRRIRQKLIDSGSTTKYLLYAVGEILLVVIGILIALQVNNWNEGRKEHQQYLLLLENLMSDAQTNVVRLSGEVEQGIYIRDRIEQFLEMVSASGNEVPVDTLSEYSEYLFQISSFSTPASSAYETAKSTGEIGMIADKSLGELYLEFQEERQWVEFHVELSGDMVYSTSFWELRKRVGSMEVFENSDAESYPDDFRLTDQQYRSMLREKEIFAAAESMLWIQRNLTRGIIHMRDINDEILQRLNALLDE